MQRLDELRLEWLSRGLPFCQYRNATPFVEDVAAAIATQRNWRANGSC
jgi:hypothetical protein